MFKDRIEKFKKPFIRLKEKYNNPAIDYIIDNHLSYSTFPKTIKLLHDKNNVHIGYTIDFDDRKFISNKNVNIAKTYLNVYEYCIKNYVNIPIDIYSIILKEGLSGNKLLMNIHDYQIKVLMNGMDIGKNLFMNNIEFYEKITESEIKHPDTIFIIDLISKDQRGFYYYPYAFPITDNNEIIKIFITIFKYHSIKIKSNFTFQIFNDLSNFLIQNQNQNNSEIINKILNGNIIDIKYIDTTNSRSMRYIDSFIKDIESRKLIDVNQNDILIEIAPSKFIINTQDGKIKTITYDKTTSFIGFLYKTDFSNERVSIDDKTKIIYNIQFYFVSYDAKTDNIISTILNTYNLYIKDKIGIDKYIYDKIPKKYFDEGKIKIKTINLLNNSIESNIGNTFIVRGNPIQLTLTYLLENRFKLEDNFIPIIENDEWKIIKTDKIELKFNDFAKMINLDINNISKLSYKNIYKYFSQYDKSHHLIKILNLNTSSKIITIKYLLNIGNPKIKSNDFSSADEPYGTVILFNNYTNTNIGYHINSINLNIVSSGILPDALMVDLLPYIYIKNDDIEKIEQLNIDGTFNIINKSKIDDMIPNYELFITTTNNKFYNYKGKIIRSIKNHGYTILPIFPFVLDQNESDAFKNAYSYHFQLISNFNMSYTSYEDFVKAKEILLTWKEKKNKLQNQQIKIFDGYINSVISFKKYPTNITELFVNGNVIGLDFDLSQTKTQNLLLLVMWWTQYGIVLELELLRDVVKNVIQIQEQTRIHVDNLINSLFEIGVVKKDDKCLIINSDNNLIEKYKQIKKILNILKIDIHIYFIKDFEYLKTINPCFKSIEKSYAININNEDLFNDLPILVQLYLKLIQIKRLEAGETVAMTFKEIEDKNKIKTDVLLGKDFKVDPNLPVFAQYRGKWDNEKKEYVGGYWNYVKSILEKNMKDKNPLVFANLNIFDWQEIDVRSENLHDLDQDFLMNIINKSNTSSEWKTINQAGANKLSNLSILDSNVFLEKKDEGKIGFKKSYLLTQMDQLGQKKEKEKNIIKVLIEQLNANYINIVDEKQLFKLVGELVKKKQSELLDLKGFKLLKDKFTNTRTKLSKSIREFIKEGTLQRENLIFQNDSLADIKINDITIFDKRGGDIVINILK
jgi:hypothetical protein